MDLHRIIHSWSVSCLQINHEWDEYSRNEYQWEDEFCSEGPSESGKLGAATSDMVRHYDLFGSGLRPPDVHSTSLFRRSLAVFRFDCYDGVQVNAYFFEVSRILKYNAKYEKREYFGCVPHRGLVRSPNLEMCIYIVCTLE